MATATSLALQGTLCFRLNLNRGALEVTQRAAVVAGSYRPLLALFEARPWLSAALGASAHTLQRIERLDPEWIARLRGLIRDGRVEFVGSGDSHLVGPLVPAAVNRWNQVLGREACERILGRAPRVARVNELAWSQGLVDAYLDAGYEAVVLEWSRARRAHPDWDDAWRARPAWTSSPTGRRIQVLWSEAGLGRLFRCAGRGELEPEEYVAALEEHSADRTQAGPRHVFLADEEAEAFGASAASCAGAAEDARRDWERIGAVLDRLHQEGLVFTTPGEVLADARLRPERALEIATGADPIPCASPPEGRVTRWALGGWDNLGVNARCFARLQELERLGGPARDWQLLCRAWASDLRAELSPARWKRFARSLPERPAAELVRTAFQDAPVRSRLVERAGRRLAVGTDGVRAVLNLRRGLALDSLTMLHAGPEPLFGSLPLAFAADAEWPTELTSGHAILELPGAERVTDLVAVTHEVEDLPQCVCVRASVPTALGPLTKELRVYAQRLEIRYGFGALGLRRRARVCAGVLTLLEGALGDELWVTCANGGPRERWKLPVEPGAVPAAGVHFGATDGWLSVDDGARGFELCWPQAEAPALPLLTLRGTGRRRLLQLGFLLSEDLGGDAAPLAPAPGALRDFRFSIRPWRKRR